MSLMCCIISVKCTCGGHSYLMTFSCIIVINGVRYFSGMSIWCPLMSVVIKWCYAASLSLVEWTFWGACIYVVQLSNELRLLKLTGRVLYFGDLYTGGAPFWVSIFGPVFPYKYFYTKMYSCLNVSDWVSISVIFYWYAGHLFSTFLSNCEI